LAVSTKPFLQFVQDSVAAIQGAAAQLVDMTPGAIFRAFVDAYSLLALWIQGIALQTASLARFATSNGPDADSWGAQYGFARELGNPASGPVTFARFTPTAVATIQVGAIVQTQTGVQYQVIADTTQGAFNAGLNAYVIAAGVSSASVTISALVSGSSGNAGAGFINVLSSSIPGVDTVSNAAPFVNGTDPQTDPQYKAGFPLFLQSLSNATPAAIRRAVQAVGENVDFTYTENQSLAGVFQPGFFFVIADDGSGSPPSGFLTAIGNAIEAVRGDSVTYAVFAPTVATANVAMVLTTATGFVHATVVAAVIAALQAQINVLPIGADLPYNFLASIAFSVPGVINVTAITLNGGTTDLVTTASQIVKIGTAAVS
jgi:hypothetical protein